MAFSRYKSVSINILGLFQNKFVESKSKYRTRAIIARSWSETALVYKPRILGLKNEEFLFLVHKYSVI